MTKDEELAMDLALEALEYFSDTSPTMAGKAHAEDAITAIKQARSAPVQEPVAFNAGVPPLYPEMKDGETISVEYTNPPGGRQSEDCLTAAQKDIQRLSALVRAQQITIDKLEQARSAPVQEPVAWINAEKRTFEWNGPVLWNTPTVAVLNKIPLYTTPPAAQRQWVGLTDEEMHECAGEYPWTPTGLKCCRAIEAKLKEKNA